MIKDYSHIISAISSNLISAMVRVFTNHHPINFVFRLMTIRTGAYKCTRLPFCTLTLNFHFSLVI
jgi:hypothetical protein